MKSPSLLIVGCGDLGARTGMLLLERGWRISGVRRNTARLPAGFEGYAADYTLPGSLDYLAGAQPDYMVITLNPFDRSEAGYRRGFQSAMANLLAGLGQHRPRHIVMASSTRVYGERDGGWVEESSPLTTDDPSAQAIIHAEQALLSSGHNASVVRFAGIYGHPGGRLLERIRRGELCPPEPVRYTNRIHREDCAGFLAHLLQLVEAGSTPERLYIGVDNHPAPRYEVECWLAEILGVALPDGDMSSAGDEPTRHSAGHRRCRNRALTASGYSLRYPDYRSGYGALLDLD